MALEIDAKKLERRILFVSGAFVFSLFALVLLADQILDLGLPTCVTDIKPFTRGEVIAQPENRYEVRYVARMWKFDPPEVRIPVGAVVDLYLSSADVNHGFNILGTDVNLMAVPGAVNYVRTKFEKPGDYEVLCNEYCGTGHQNMETVIHVYDPIISQPMSSAAQAKAVSDHPGYKVLETKACLACHTVDGSQGTGPSFLGLYGRTEALQDGSSVLAEDSYIRESIRLPMAKIVKGFSPVMPTLPVTDSEIDQIIAYFKTLQKK